MHRRTLTQEADARAISAFLVCLDDTLSFHGGEVVPKATTTALSVAVSHRAQYHSQYPPPIPKLPSFPATAHHLKTVTTSTIAPSQSSPPHPQHEAVPADSAAPSASTAFLPLHPLPHHQPTPLRQQSPFPSLSRSRSFSHPTTPRPKVKGSTQRASLLLQHTQPQPLADFSTPLTMVPTTEAHHPHAKAVSQPWLAGPKDKDGRLASTLAWACLLAVEGEPRHEEFLSAYEAGVAVVVPDEEVHDEREGGEEEEEGGRVRTWQDGATSASSASTTAAAAAGGSIISGDSLRKGSMPAICIPRRKTSVGSLRSVFSIESEDSSSSSFSSCSSSSLSSTSYQHHHQHHSISGRRSIMSMRQSRAPSPSPSLMDV